MTDPTPSVTTSDLVLLDVDAGSDKEAVIGRLAGTLADAGRSTDRAGLTAAAMAREGQSATGLPGGIAIPHCRSPYVDSPSIGFARLNPAVDFGAPDGPADLVFLIAAPDSGGAEHMKLLSSLARSLVRPEFVQSLRDASSADDVVALVEGVVNPAPAAPAAAAAVPVAGAAALAEPKTAVAATKTIVAVTACPTGIAHTYMAADALELAAERGRGQRSWSRRRARSGSTPLDPTIIAGADAVDLRHRRRRPGPGPLRRQAGDRLRRQARRSTNPTR